MELNLRRNDLSAFTNPGGRVGSTALVRLLLLVGLGILVSGAARAQVFSPQAPPMSSVSLRPMSVGGGYTVTGTITLSVADPFGALIFLSSSNSGVASVSGYVKIPAGSISTTFTVTTTAVSHGTSVVLTATEQFGNSLATTLLVQPNPAFDFNQYGTNDLLFQNRQTGDIAAWSLDGISVLRIRSLILTPQAGWMLVGAGDFDDDGQPDLVFQNQTTGNVVIWYMNGTTVREGSATSIAPGSDFKVVGIGDFNNDGKPDILFQSQSTGQIAVWFMNDSTVIGGGNLATPTPAGYKVVGVGDFNGDGQPDIVMQNSVTNQIVVWYMNGVFFSGGGFTSMIPAQGWQVKGIADYNYDGKPDLVFQNSTTNQVFVWFMNGLMVTGGDLISAQPSAPYQLVGPH